VEACFDLGALTEGQDDERAHAPQAGRHHVVQGHRLKRRIPPTQNRPNPKARSAANGLSVRPSTDSLVAPRSMLGTLALIAAI
jgi:hypothetical protein